MLSSYALILTIYGVHALPDPLLVVLFVVSVIAVSAENLDVSSREFPLFCAVSCPHTCSSIFSHPCVKMVEFHHPSFFFSMVLKSIRLVASILVADVTEKSHFFNFTPIK